MVLLEEGQIANATDKDKINDFVGYCVRCNKKVIVTNPEIINKQTRKGFKVFIKGICSSCNKPLNSLKAKVL